jgi:peroxiredoxin
LGCIFRPQAAAQFGGTCFNPGGRAEGRNAAAIAAFPAQAIKPSYAKTTRKIERRISIMPIKVGDHLPNAKFRIGTPEGPAWKTTDEVFKGKKVALFAVPGAFTGTCHKMHVPSIVQSLSGLKGKGIDTVAVTSVNDVFVMDAWKKATAADGIEFLADGNADFAKAIDLTLDGSGNGLGLRSRRYSMLVEDGVVKKLNIEEAPGKVEVSGGDALLKQL